MDETDLPQLFRMLAALAFVLALMGGFAYVLRRMGFDSKNPASRKRLKLIETLTLDSRRKLVIIERDSKQHLLLLGPNSESVIESGIESGQDMGIIPKDTI